MKNLAIALAFFTGITFLTTSCNKTTKGRWVTYEETGCLPFWADTDSDRQSIKTLTSFLKAEGIIPLKIKIRGEREFGVECYEETGLEYLVQVDKSQIGYMSFYGFELR